KQAISSKIYEKDFSYWCNDFAHLDLCVEGVLTITEAINHPHFLERNMLCYAVNNESEEILQINSALPFKSQAKYKSGAALGANTYEILKSLSYTSEAIDGLLKSGCVLQNM
ncbi:MAG: alpha-methylacyl-CoA racemase, partial [Oleiphilaceae bacterium]